jgi:glycosyltransferase involved in cell wall biosynthesis
MNVGGPAHHVSLLSGRLDRGRFDSLLLVGAVGPGEASLEALADSYGARRETVPGLGPVVDPKNDVRALRGLIAKMREFRPHIVHTHTAKAGMLGRVAARLALGPRPIVIHTYHGHVLRGYFGRTETAAYRAIEMGLARVSDCLVGVSDATVDDLIELGVAPRERFRVIHLGLDLARFLEVEPSVDHGAVRDELGVASDEVLAVFVGRLVPIKRVDVLLRAFEHARARDARLRLLVVGDGESRDELERKAADLGIEQVTTFTGFRDDLDVVAAATDIAVLSSDNEGTPVALIEAAAAARPAVATSVGGVPEVVTPESGFLVPPDDPSALGDALVALAADADRRRTMGLAGRRHVRDRYDAGRLVRDVERLYEDLLSARAGS